MLNLFLQGHRALEIDEVTNPQSGLTPDLQSLE